MSTKTLAITGAKPYGLTYDQYPIYRINAGQGTKYEEVITTASTPSLSPPYASVLRVDIDYNFDDFVQINEHYLDWNAVNSSATEAPTFKNAYALISSIKVLFNNVVVDECKNADEIFCRVSNYLREHADNVSQAIAYFRNDTTPTYTGDSFPVSSTTNFQLPLSVLLPWLKGFVIGGSAQVRKLQYEITFQQNYSSITGNGAFVVSNTTSNAYSTNLSYTNISIRQALMRPQPEARQSLLSRMTPKIMRIGHEAKVKTVSWTNLNTDMTTFSLKTDWSHHKNVRGMIVYITCPALITAYNDTDCCKVFSGAQYIGYKVRYNGSEVLNHSVAVADLKKRKNYSMLVQKNLWEAELPLEVINRTDGLADYYLAETYIDLQNISVHNSHETIIAGVSTDTNIQVDFYCVGSIGAVCNITNMLEYVEEIMHDGKGNYKIEKDI